MKSDLNFWKDKSTYLMQAKSWDIQKLNKALNKIYITELN